MFISLSALMFIYLEEFNMIFGNTSRKQTLLEMESYARRALDSEFGVRVITNNTERFKSEFYQLRKPFPELSNLTLRTPKSDPGSVWIIPTDILES